MTFLSCPTRTTYAQAGAEFRRRVSRGAPFPAPACAKFSVLGSRNATSLMQGCAFPAPNWSQLSLD